MEGRWWWGLMAPGTGCADDNWLEGQPKSASRTFLPSLSELVYLLPIKLDGTSLPVRNQLESNPVMSSDDDYLALFFCETRSADPVRREEDEGLLALRRGLTSRAGHGYGTAQTKMVGRLYCGTCHPVLSTSVSLFFVGSGLFVFFLNFALYSTLGNNN